MTLEVGGDVSGSGLSIQLHSHGDPGVEGGLDADHTFTQLRPLHKCATVHTHTHTHWLSEPAGGLEGGWVRRRGLCLTCVQLEFLRRCSSFFLVLARLSHR